MAAGATSARELAAGGKSGSDRGVEQPATVTAATASRGRTRGIAVWTRERDDLCPCEKRRVMTRDWASPPAVAGSSDAAYAHAMSAERTETRKRSLVKAISYRAVIVCLDFLAIYIFTHKADVAFGFMIVSNVYTTVGYFLHERFWARVRWGMGPKPVT
jgi:uncharacterized membrane protein